MCSHSVPHITVVLDYSECLTIGMQVSQLVVIHQSLYCLALVAHDRGLVQSVLQFGHCTVPQENASMAGFF